MIRLPKIYAVQFLALLSDFSLTVAGVTLILHDPNACAVFLVAAGAMKVASWYIWVSINEKEEEELKPARPFLVDRLKRGNHNQRQQSGQ